MTQWRGVLETQLRVGVSGDCPPEQIRVLFFFSVIPVKHPDRGGRSYRDTERQMTHLGTEELVQWIRDKRSSQSWGSKSECFNARLVGMIKFLQLNHTLADRRLVLPHDLHSFTHNIYLHTFSLQNGGGGESTALLLFSAAQGAHEDMGNRTTIATIPRLLKLMAKHDGRDDGLR